MSCSYEKEKKLFRKKHKTQAKYLKKNMLIKDIHRMYSLLDTKTSGLLTYVSLMVAGCLLLYSKNNIFLILAICYMVVGFLLLSSFNISMYDMPKYEKCAENFYVDNCFKRVKRYKRLLFTVKVVTVFTIIFAFLCLLISECKIVKDLFPLFSNIIT